MIKIIALIALSSLSTSIYAQETIKCETDEFQGTTLCKTESIKLSTSDSDVSRATLHLVYIFEIESYLLVPSITSGEWQYTKTDRVYFLIDGERANYKLHKVDGKESGSTIIEQYYIQLGAKDAERFSRAKEVRFKIDNDIYNLSTDAKGKLEALIRKTNELQKAF